MTSSAAWDLAWGIIGVLIIFALAVGAKRTLSIGALLILIPFQIVDTRFASSSVLMAYALAGVLIISGGIKVRLLPAIGFIVLAYFASLSFADRSILVLHLTFMLQFFSCLLVFLLAYNFATLVKDERSTIDLLLAINVLSIGYCILQLAAGPSESFVPFGIESLSFNKNRQIGDPRLVGPFDNPGTTGGYFTLMVLVCVVDLMFARGRRRVLVWGIIGFNLFGLVATGNRTSFLILLTMFPVLLFTFRRQLGTARALQFLIGSALILVLSATIAVAYSGFDQLFTRMSTVTAVEGGVPTTRTEGWPVAIEKIRQRPWFGEGPHFWTAEDAEKTGELPVEFDGLGELSTSYDPFPHSLYLYELRTVGVFGLAAVVGFFLIAWQILYVSRRRETVGGYQSAIVRLGILVVPAFLVAQITLEFNRPQTIDYAQFIFALMGLLIGTSDRTLPPPTAARPIPPQPVAAASSQ